MPATTITTHILIIILNNNQGRASTNTMTLILRPRRRVT